MTYRRTRTVALGACALALVSLCAAPVTASAESPSWPESTAASFNLGGDVSGTYTDTSGNSFNGDGAIVIDIDGAFTPGNSAFVAPDGTSKVIGEACIGQERGTTPFPSLCITTTVVKSSAPGGDPMYFSTLPKSSTPSDSPVSACADNGAFCHSYHGTATAGAIVGQPGHRYENGEKLYTAGAAVGAKVFQLKIGGGDSTTATAGWPHESVVDALYWVNKVLSETAGYKGKIAAINISVSGALRSASTACGTAGMQIDAAAAHLKQKGIAVVMSAGNDGAHGTGTWNCGPNVVTVGATNISTPHTLWDKSNRDDTVKLFAPVGNGNRADQNMLLLPWKSSGTFYPAGTSFASPQVAGAYAVLREKFGAAPTVDELTGLLQRTGTPVVGAHASPDAVDINITAALNDQP